MNTPTSNSAKISMNGLLVEKLQFLDRGPYNFGVPAGTVFGLSGSSGSGKTLLLRAISDLDPSSGRVTLNGICSQSISGPEWRQKVAWLPAESLWWHDHVGAHFWREPDSASLAELGFAAEVMKWEISRLSTGEKQRLAILRLLQHRPEALLLDEPTASLDKGNISAVEKFITRYLNDHHGLAIWVSHDSEQLERVAACHHALLLGGEMRKLR
jgi:ABC-type iron transport system FetAB ATPase subunit